MKIYVFLIFATFLTMNLTGQSVPQLAKTPPMGWNSWDCFGMDITEVQMKANTDYMAKNLKKYGWEYVVLDMGWFYDEGLTTLNFQKKDPPQVIDEFGRVYPNPRKFPSSVDGNGLKSLGDYIHSKGLKFGIHIMRGIPNEAVEKNTPIKGTSYRAKDIASEQNLCPWYHGLYTVDMSKPGAQEYYNSLLEQYAEWGVDFIKADAVLSKYYHNTEIEAIHKAIVNCGRPIVLSLSAGPLSVDKFDHLRKNNANMWRITNDMWDDWSFVVETFEQCRYWQKNVTINHWPDCDMLPLGKLRINGSNSLFTARVNSDIKSTTNEFSRLTTDEKYTVMSLWSIFRSPLMMGGSLLEVDKLTKELLTNKEVLAVNQSSTNNHELRHNEEESIWMADDPISGAKYLAIFNLNSQKQREIEVSWDELVISGKHQIRDLWKRKNIGVADSQIKASVAPHGCVFYRLGK
jgi:hypothetical protein